jgi:hypothetical protein
MIVWKKFHIDSSLTGKTTESRGYYFGNLLYRTNHTMYLKDGDLSWGWVLYGDKYRSVGHFDSLEDVILFCERDIKLKFLDGDCLGTEN